MSEDKPKGPGADPNIEQDPGVKDRVGAEGTASQGIGSSQEPTGTPPQDGRDIDLEQAWHGAGDFSGAPADPSNDPDDDFDPELLRMPRPRRRRHPIISVVVIAFSIFLMARSWSDFSYFFADSKPKDLGPVSELMKRKETLEQNSYVAIQGVPVRKHALLIRGRVSGYYRFFLLRKSENSIFAQHHDTQRTNERALIGNHVGRLVRFSSLSYRQGVRDYFARFTSVPHDFDLKALAKVARAGGTTKDNNGVATQIKPDTIIWINAVHKDEWIVQFAKNVYANRAAAAARLSPALATLPVNNQGPSADNVPYAVDDEPSTSFYRFVVKVGDDQAKRLIKAFADRSLHAGVLPRQVSYTARWDQLELSTEGLTITVKDATFPKRYGYVSGPASAPASEKTSRRLQAQVLHPVVLHRGEIKYLSSSSKFAIGDDAWVVLVGETPSDKWLFALLYGLLAAFIVFNGAAIYLRLRRR